MTEKRGPYLTRRRAKRPDSAALARPKRVAVTHGGRSALLHAPLDRRTRFGRLHRAQVDALCRHLGGDVTVAQARLVDQAVRLRLLSELAWSELLRGGAFTEAGDPRPALDAFRRLAGDERSLLALLGVERREQPVASLDQYLNGHQPA